MKSIWLGKSQDLFFKFQIDFHYFLHNFRQTLDRAVSQKIPMKKMRTLFKKYLDFEQRFGDDDLIRNVKLLAANYVEREVHDK